MDEFHRKGYTIVEDIYTPEEIALIIDMITTADVSGPAFRKTNDLYAIREFLKEVPEIQAYIFNAKLKSLIAENFGSDYVPVKSIYFDKPSDSNWFVAWHQDLMISVNKKLDLPGFGPWTQKEGQYAVRPPVSYLENIFTIRIHLDDTDEDNGALRVIPGSHTKGIHRYSSENLDDHVVCKVPRGGAMIMRPLLQHASRRTVNQKGRRVIHIEFSNDTLPEGLNWRDGLS